MHYDIPANILTPVIAAFTSRIKAYPARAAIRNVACFAEPAIRTKGTMWKRPHLAQSQDGPTVSEVQNHKLERNVKQNHMI